MGERRTCACGAPAVLSGQCGPCFQGIPVRPTCPACGRQAELIARVGLCGTCTHHLRRAADRARAGVQPAHLSDPQRASVRACDAEGLLIRWPVYGRWIGRLRLALDRETA